MDTCIVYGLRLIGTDEVRYVGQTSRSLAWRLAGHIYASGRGSNLPVHCWIRHHGAAAVEAVVLVKLAKLNTSEMRVIKRLRKAGNQLLNCTDGGDGVRGKHRQPMSQAHRDKISAIHKGRLAGPHSIETRIKMSAAKKSKLTPAKVANARLQHESGARVCDIARQLGVSYQAAWKAIKGYKWTHVGVSD